MVLAFTDIQSCTCFTIMFMLYKYIYVFLNLCLFVFLRIKSCPTGKVPVECYPTGTMGINT